MLPQQPYRRLSLRFRGPPVALQKQQRTAPRPQVRALGRVHGRQDRTVQQLGHRGLDVGGGERGHGLGTLGEGVEVRGDGGGRLRYRPQPYRRGGDHTQGALGAGEQRRQVVAGDSLDGAPTGPYQRPVGEHRVQPEDGVPGHPVLGAAQPARVGRDVPAHRGDRRARRVGRVAQSKFARRTVQFGGDDARLHDGGLFLGAQFEDPVHPRQVDDDTARPRVRPAGQPGARPARHDRHPHLVRVPQRGLYVLGPGGVHDRQRLPVRAAARAVGGVRRGGLGPDAERTLGQFAAEHGEEPRGRGTGVGKWHETVLSAYEVRGA